MNNNKPERAYRNQAINPLIQNYGISVEMSSPSFRKKKVFTKILFCASHLSLFVKEKVLSCSLVLTGVHTTVKTNTFIVVHKNRRRLASMTHMAIYF